VGELERGASDVCSVNNLKCSFSFQEQTSKPKIGVCSCLSSSLNHDTHFVFFSSLTLSFFFFILSESYLCFMFSYISYLILI
jgi:hypothetical protein